MIRRASTAALRCSSESLSQKVDALRATRPAEEDELKKQRSKEATKRQENSGKHRLWFGKGEA